MADLGEAYRRSNMLQRKILLSSVFTMNLAWNYNDGLDYKISPLYQYIQRFDGQGAPFGAGDANYFSPFLLEILAHFNNLMEIYQAQALGKLDV